MLATLSSLRIKNLALVEDLAWQLAPGFVAVTGETGAGKSVILGALKLLLGERADKTLIRTGAEACTVEAVFDVPDTGPIATLLAGSGIEDCAEGQLIVKRTFTLAGANRQFINGSPTTIAVLKALGDGLVDLHGPHDHQSLLSAGRQLDVLDAFARAEPARREYEDAFRRLGELRAEHKSLAGSEAANERELYSLRRQAEEIGAAQLTPDEETALHSRYTVAANSKRLIELATGIAAELAETEPSILGRLGETARMLRDMERLDPGAAPLVQAHASAVAELEELASALVRHAEKLDIDAEQLARMEERLDLLQGLKRKYGNTIQAVIAYGEEAGARLEKIESRGADLARLEERIAAGSAELLQRGGRLSELRAEGAPALSEAVSRQLRDLGFKKSEFAIHLEPLAEPGAAGLESAEFVFAPRSSGMESVEFLFAPNAGEPAKPLRSIASSGEISRVMLAVKSALADQDAVPLMVFDEIDANVGGEIAHAVGSKMRSLGRKHQVLCITHLPQVAAQAQSHVVVTKDFDEASARTHSRLTQVEGKERVREIARMLGGQSESSLALARTLLAGGR